MLAVGALEQRAIAQRPQMRALATRARRRAAPARLDPPVAAILLAGEPRLELGRGLGKAPPQIIPHLLRHGANSWLTLLDHAIALDLWDLSEGDRYEGGS